MKHARRSITRGSVRDAMSVLCGIEDPTPLVVPVIMRGNASLFQALMTKVTTIPDDAMEYLIVKPNMLRIALSKGLDPNTLIAGRLPTEVAARKHMYASLKELFKCPNVKVTRYVVNRLQNNIPMYTQAIEHAPACREDVVNAIRVRSNALLQRALHKLKSTAPITVDEPAPAPTTPARPQGMFNFNDDAPSNDEIVNTEEPTGDDSTDVRKWSDKKWAEEVEDKLRCPILLQATAEPVRVPSGHVYDADSIHAWVHTHGNNTMTREPLTKDDLVSVGATILGNLLVGVLN